MKISRIISRLLWSFAVLFVVVSATFLLLQVLPGDPIKMMMGERVNPEVVANIRAQMGLDEPLFKQFVGFWAKIFQLDFGRSYRLKMPVIDLLKEASVVTMQLAFYSMSLAVIGGLLIGVTAALHRGKWLDNLLMSLAVLNISTPSFWFALMLQLIFGLGLGILPISGYRTPLHFVLPSLALGLRYMASLARLTRTSMLEVLSSEYLLAAKAKGVGPLRLIWVHAFGNALLPIMTYIGGSLADMLAGAMIIEQIFGLPGVGQLTISSLLSQDLPLLQATVIYLTVISVGIYLLVDWLALFVDPRVRMGEKGNE
jgi:peptide/nickel transport system permease protein